VNPVTRALEGVLDISCPEAHATPLLRPFVISTVRMIEQMLAENACTSDKIVVESYRAAVRRRRRAPVLVLHDGAVVANAAAMELLEAADQAIFRELAENATHFAPQCHQVVLTSGVAVDVRLQAIRLTRNGVLFEIDPVESGARIPRGAAMDPARRTAPGVPVELLDTLSTRAPVLIAGEPGSGRTTMARSLAGEHEVHLLDSATAQELGVQAWLDELAGLAGLPGLLLVEDVHLLPDDAAHRLSALVESGVAWIAMTSGPIGSAKGELAGLVARCVARTETVPLRRRDKEFGLVVRSMLARLGADASVRMTPETIEILAAHSWPGNLRELAEVLRGRRRPVGPARRLPTRRAVAAPESRAATGARRDRHRVALDRREQGRGSRRAGHEPVHAVPADPHIAGSRRRLTCATLAHLDRAGSGHHGIETRTPRTSQKERRWTRSSK
jgi:hypothetical protein